VIKKNSNGKTGGIYVKMHGDSAVYLEKKASPEI
jgi:hypothetical protein